ncbi:MAG: CBS domain-containing protein [Deltaproteobacteria bacterium]|nr:CBS domain-containing protein [Deltaproteobacteria bacterium]
MKVADCMTPEPACLTPDDTLTAAVALMEAGDFRAVPITLNGNLVGIISDRDIRSSGRKPHATKVSERMSRNVVCVSPDDSVNEAVRMILSNKIGGLPVVKENKLLGMITTTDILKAVLGFPALDT